MPRCRRSPVPPQPRPAAAPSRRSPVPPQPRPAATPCRRNPVPPQPRTAATPNRGAAIAGGLRRGSLAPWLCSRRGQGSLDRLAHAGHGEGVPLWVERGGWPGAIVVTPVGSSMSFDLPPVAVHEQMVVSAEKDAVGDKLQRAPFHILGVR